MDEVRVESKSYSGMEATWKLHMALLGGTIAMREQASTYLPQEDKEQKVKYDARLSRSVLYEALKDTINRLVSKPFSKPVILEGTLPERLKSMADDVDRAGRDLTDFSRDVFWDAMAYGKSHFIVDFPNTEGLKTLADERAAEIRPAFVHLPALDVIGWRSEIRQGQSVLTQLRYIERSVEAEGKFGEEEVERVVVWTEDKITRYAKASNDKGWAEESSHDNTLGKIPLVTVYTNRTGFMLAEPPLEGLAWLNLLHWQSTSDQRNILRFARMGIMFASGFSEDEIRKGITVGTNALNHSTNEAAKLQWVEHKGTAIEAGHRDIADLEERMEVMGLQPLIERTSRSTATGIEKNDGRANTSIQSWVSNMATALKQGYALAAEWNDEVADVSVTISNDFGLSLRAATNVKALIEMRKGREITRTTFLKEIKRYGVLGDDLDVEEEVELLDAEDADLSVVGITPGDGIEEEDE